MTRSGPGGCEGCWAVRCPVTCWDIRLGLLVENHEWSGPGDHPRLDVQLFYRTVVDLSSNLLLPSFCSQLLRDVEGALTMKRSSRLS